jgi:hypothetical protein
LTHTVTPPNVVPGDYLHRADTTAQLNQQMNNTGAVALEARRIGVNLGLVPPG